MANFKKAGKKEIRSGERDVAKGVLGPRGYDIVKGTDKIIKGETRERENRSSSKRTRR